MNQKMLAQLSVSCAIVMATIGLSFADVPTVVHVNNGLGRPVRVSFGGDPVRLPAYSHVRMAVGNRDKYSVRTTTVDGALIEQFDVNIAPGSSTSVYNVASASAMVEKVVVYGQKEDPPPPRLIGMDRWLNTKAEYIFDEPPVIGFEGGKRTLLAADGHRSPWIMMIVTETPKQFADVARVHAIYDLGTTERVLDWIGMVAMKPGFDEVLRARLALEPKDAVTLREEQMNIARPEQGEQICARHRALAQSEPHNADLQFVAARCDRDRTRRHQAYLDLYAREPRNGWAAYGASVALLDQKHWQEALQPLSTALRANPAMRSRVAEDLLRVHRWLANDDLPIGALSICSRRLMGLQTLEQSRNDVDYTYEAYYDLARGEPNRAAKVARSSSDPNMHGFALAAASEGVDREIVRQVLALSPTEGKKSDVTLFTYVLAVREGAAEVAAIFGRQVFERPILDFISALHRGGSHAQAEQLLDGVEFKMRIRAYAAAVVLQGDRAPPEWRRIATRMMFADERPYFAPLARAEKPSRQERSVLDSYEGVCERIAPAVGYGKMGGD